MRIAKIIVKYKINILIDEENKEEIKLDDKISKFLTETNIFEDKIPKNSKHENSKLVSFKDNMSISMDETRKILWRSRKEK